MTGAEFGGVDIDLLADYIGGALTGTPDESAVAARIADDQDWQAAYASLTEGMAFVSAELGRFEPEPMPADLAARLDAALTTQSAELASTGRPGASGELGATAQANFLDLIAAGVDPESAAVEAETAESELGAGETGRRPVPHLALVRDGETEGDGPELVREEAPAPPRGRRLRWAAPIAVAAGVIAFVGFGLDYLAGLSGPTKSDTSASSGESTAKRATTPLNGQALIAPGRLLASGTDYTRVTLAVAPDEPMTAPYASSGSAPAPRAPGVAPDSESALQRLTLPAVLNDCLNAIEQANAAGPLAVESVDYARYSGAPAVIVRFSASNGRWAWASGPDCGTPPGDAATLDQVPVG